MTASLCNSSSYIEKRSNWNYSKVLCNYPYNDRYKTQWIVQVHSCYAPKDYLKVKIKLYIQPFFGKKNVISLWKDDRTKKHNWKKKT